MSARPVAAAEALAGILSRHTALFMLAAVFLIAVAVSDAFLEPRYLGNVLRQAAPLGIAAIGVTYVMILGGVDLSVGAVVSLTAVICAVAMDGQPANLGPAVALACAVGLAIGLGNGLLIALSRVSPFILTLGTGIALFGLAQVYSGGTARGIVSPGFREALNLRLGGWMPVLALAFLGLAALGFAVQRWTVFGRQLFLIGANPRAAALAGLPVMRVTVVAYALSGLFGALAGVALLARSGVSGSLSGQGLEFQVLAAVVLGGTTFEGGRGGIPGTVAGVLVLIIAFNLVNISGLSYHVQLILMGAIIVLASALYGRLGRAGA